MQRSLILSLLILLVIAFLAILIGISSGSVSISMSDTLQALWNSRLTNETSAQIIQTIRLPRVLAAFAVGGLLALSGVLMQVLLKNPLADPYIMGISGGAALGALIGLYFNLGASLGYLFAACGAMLSILLVFCSRTWRRQLVLKSFITYRYSPRCWLGCVDHINTFNQSC